MVHEQEHPRRGAVDHRGQESPTGTIDHLKRYELDYAEDPPYPSRIALPSVERKSQSFGEHTASVEARSIEEHLRCRTQPVGRRKDSLLKLRSPVKLAQFVSPQDSDPTLGYTPQTLPRNPLMSPYRLRLPKTETAAVTTGFRRIQTPRSDQSFFFRYD